MKATLERIASALEMLVKYQQDKEAELKSSIEKAKRTDHFIRKAYAAYPQLAGQPLTMGPDVLDIIIAAKDPLAVLGHLLKDKETGNRLSLLEIDDAKKEIEAIDKRLSMAAV
jgi:hypothetical protein